MKSGIPVSTLSRVHGKSENVIISSKYVCPICGNVISGKEHYISFIAAVSDNGIEIIKLYPEGNAQTRINRRGVKILYCYCNRHGLMKLSL